MSQYKTVIVERQERVAVVTLNRPDGLNAFDEALRQDLRAAVREVNEDDGIWAVVLTGAGRAFCAGADLNEMQSLPEDFRIEDQIAALYKPSLMEIIEAPKPWISAVKGAAAGIGSSYAMACDLTVMAENAFIYQAFGAIGLVPDGGATWHLCRTLGRKRAYEIILSGEKIGARQCLEFGLCNRVVPTDDFLEEALAWAREIAAKAPLAVRYAKRAIYGAMENSVGDTIDAEARLQHICLSSEDAQEGASAFLAKRAPQWKGL